MSASSVINSKKLVSSRFQSLLSIWPPTGQRAYTEFSQAMSTELYRCHWRIVAVSGPSFILSFSSIYDSQQSTYPITFTFSITFRHLLSDLFSRPNLLTLRYGNTSFALNLSIRILSKQKIHVTHKAAMHLNVAALALFLTAYFHTSPTLQGPTHFPIAGVVTYSILTLVTS
jgi:hypothetical protein